MVLAERGKPAEYVIVKSAKAGECEAYAAEELRDFIAKTTGVALTIATDEQPVPEKAIVLGTAGGNPSAPELGEDGFRLRADGAKLRVVASPKRGVLYGVYSILEKYAGCRWYSSRCSRIPAIARLEVPSTLDVTEKPAFLMREAYWFDAICHHDFAARLRLNGYNHARSAPAKFGGDSFRYGGGLGSCHTFGRLVPVDKYFKDHPEYFAMRNGRRAIDEKHAHWGYTQLCLTNPDVLEIVVSNVIERIRKDPGAKFYGVSQNDNQLYCECPACAAVDAEEESHAGTVVRFVNAVAERVEKVFPDVVIETLAYQYSRTPPKKTRLRHNVVPCLCTIECDFSRSIDESSNFQNVKFRSDIEGWKTQTDQLYIWDYTTDFANYTIPFPNVLALQGNLKFFRANNVKEVFEQGDAMGNHGDFAELKTWLLAKWMWNPELPAGALLDDFFSGYYGKGAPFVRRYFDELHTLQRAHTAAGRGLGCFESVNNRALDNAFLDRAAALWASAAEAVKDDPQISYNVRMGAFTVDSMRVQRYSIADGKVLWLSKAPPTSRFGEMKALAASLLARMKEAKGIRLAESQKRNDAILKAINELAAAEEPPLMRGDERGTVEERHIHLNNPGLWGEYVDDPLAEDGKALKLFNTHFEWCAQLWMNRIEFEPGVKYTVRMRARCEKAGDGEAFWAGVYDQVAKRSNAHLSRSTKQMGEGYAWYDVGTWIPNQDEYFWIGPGRFKKNGGKSAIKALWVDKIEFVRKEARLSP